MKSYSCTITFDNDALLMQGIAAETFRDRIAQIKGDENFATSKHQVLQAILQDGEIQIIYQSDEASKAGIDEKLQLFAEAMGMGGKLKPQEVISSR